MRIALRFVKFGLAMAHRQEFNSQILLRRFKGVIAELRQSRNGGSALPPHFHEEFQVILSKHRFIEYRYRGAFQNSPLGTIFVMQPGEVHSTRVLANRVSGEPLLRTFLVSAPVLGSLTRADEGSFRLPYFSSPILKERSLFLDLLSLHRLLLADADPLIEECRLLEALAKLVARSTSATVPRLLAAPPRLTRVKDVDNGRGRFIRRLVFQRVPE